MNKNYSKKNSDLEKLALNYHRLVLASEQFSDDDFSKKAVAAFEAMCKAERKLNDTIESMLEAGEAKIIESAIDSLLLGNTPEHGKMLKEIAEAASQSHLVEGKDGVTRLCSMILAPVVLNARSNSLFVLSGDVCAQLQALATDCLCADHPGDSVTVDPQLLSPAEVFPMSIEEAFNANATPDAVFLAARGANPTPGACSGDSYTSSIYFLRLWVEFTSQDDGTFLPRISEGQDPDETEVEAALWMDKSSDVLSAYFDSILMVDIPDTLTSSRTRGAILLESTDAKLSIGKQIKMTHLSTDDMVLFVSAHGHNDHVNHLRISLVNDEGDLVAGHVFNHSHQIEAEEIMDVISDISECFECKMLLLLPDVEDIDNGAPSDFFYTPTGWKRLQQAPMHGSITLH